MSTTTTTAPAVATDLSLTRLHLMRAGYLLMGVGLALVKWPQLPEANDRSLCEGVPLCMLTAVSVLAFLGLRHPVKLLPLLLLESAWKLLWLFVVAPSARPEITGDERACHRTRNSRRRPQPGAPLWCGT